MKHRFRSIKTRMTLSYFTVLLLTVVVFEFALVVAIPRYYRSSIEQYASGKVKSAVERFQSNMDTYYPAESAMREMVLELKKETKGKIQVFDADGKLIDDSTGYLDSSIGPGDDLKAAMNKGTGMMYYTDKGTDEKLLLISHKVYASGNYNIIRLVLSVQYAESVIRKLIAIIVGFGLFVLAMTAYISRYFSASIIKPVNVLKDAAVQMAEGNYQYRAEKFSDDEIGELTDAINHMAEEINKSDRMRTDFIASVSHELRTPLTAIKGWAETLDYMLQDVTEDQDILTGLEIIKKENDRLVNLVEELLDFSRLLSDRMELKMEKANLNAVLEFILKQFTFRARDKQITLVGNMQEQPIYMYADSRRLKQCLIILIDNAIKFTESGGRVEAKLGRENGYIYMSIIDNGEGIAEADLPHITEKFYKGSSTYSGSGIGLSVCAQIVHLHKGKMEIKSKLGEGTMVTLYFKEEETAVIEEQQKTVS